MKTKLARAILLAGLMQASLTHGLGLGDIKVDSGINERLDAVIELTKSKGLDASQVLVSLASKADFDRAGVSREYFLTNLRFDVVRGAGGKPALKVTSDDVVLEPFLNFLIEVRWPNGRLLRDYTVLLDLPTFSAVPARLISQSAPDPKASKTASGDTVTSKAPRSSSSSPSRETETHKAKNEGPLERRQAEPTVRSSAQNVTVAANDTLWEIALQVKPQGVTVHQTMLALQQLNPRAFINDNINLLKKGAVLRIPDFEGIAGQDAFQARKSVSDQQQQWQQKKPSDEMRAAAIDAREQSTEAQQKTDQSGHLQLAVAGAIDTDKATSLAGDGGVASTAATQSSAGSSESVNPDLTSEIEQLRSHLASSLENLDKAGVENEAMASRLDAMESQMDDLEQLVTLKDRELQSMREALAERRDALQLEGSIDNAQDLAAATSAATIDANSDGSQAKEEGASSAASALAADSAEDTKSDESIESAAANSVAKDTGILATLASALSLSTQWVIAILLGFTALIVGFVVLLFGRRQNDYEATVFEADDSSSFNDRQNDDFSSDEADIRVDESADNIEDLEDIVSTLSDDTTADSDSDLFEAIADVAQAANENEFAGGLGVSGSLDSTAASVEDELVSDSQFAEPSDLTAPADEVTTGSATAIIGAGSNDQDPLAEADVYLAFGRHEQAASMLQGALAVDPLNTELKLKLLEVHVDAGNTEAFKAVCGPFLSDDPSMNAEVETLLEPVENIADWWPGGVVSAPSDTFLDDFQDTGSDLDLDLDLDLEMESDNSDLDLSGQFNDLPDVAPDLQLAYDADSEEAAVESLADNDDEAMAEENQPMSQDEIGTKLDLARAYIDMGDVDGAREILDEVLNEGSDDQRDQAASMLKLIA